MMEHSGPEYLVRDPQGNVYGPAEPALLRQWAAQGRIVPGMYIAAKDTGQWVEASVHPELAGCFGAPAAAPPVESVSPVTPTPSTAQTPEPTARPPEPALGVGAAIPVAAPGQVPGWADAGPRENVPALISMIAGIVAVAGSPVGCLCGCFGGPLVGMAALIAIVLGLVAMSQIKADPLRYTGKNRAVAGLVLGAISLVLMVVGAILVAALGMAHR